MKMKVVQCWDDGVYNDIRLTDLLRKYDAKATFNLCPGFLQEDKRVISSWAAPGERGHLGFKSGRVSKKDIPYVYEGFQVASHCWNHETAGVQSDEDFIKAACDARKYLEDIVGRECRGFAWPMGAFTPETSELLRQNNFAYGRTTLNTDDVTRCADPMQMATNCHFMNRDFYTKYQEAKKTGVFYFWGHSYEMLDYDRLWEQFENKLQMINDDPESEWADVIDIIPLLKNA